MKRSSCWGLCCSRSPWRHLQPHHPQGTRCSPRGLAGSQLLSHNQAFGSWHCHSIVSSVIMLSPKAAMLGGNCPEIAAEGVTFAPFATASSTRDAIFLARPGRQLAPTSTTRPPCSPAAGPWRSRRATSAARDTKASWMGACTRNRSAPMQFCPAPWNAPLRAVCTTCRTNQTSR